MSSVYLDTRDGDGPLNRAHLLQLATKIEELGIPFIVGGDFQNDPDSSLITAWAEAVNGVIIKPDNWTCRQNVGEGSTIDYFIVHKEIAPR